MQEFSDEVGEVLQAFAPVLSGFGQGQHLWGYEKGSILAGKDCWTVG